MNLMREFCDQAWAGLLERVEAAKAVGGIPLQKVAEEGSLPPAGYRLDVETEYYIPCSIELFTKRITLKEGN